MIEKFNISEDEKNSLFLMYYNVLYGLKHYKGLKYKQCYTVYKSIKDMNLKVKNININDYLEVI